jgi:DNA-binding MarR family transcriptional regulator
MESRDKITLLIIDRVTDQPDLLFLLHDVARLLRLDADRRAGAHGLTRAQWVIMFWLERQPGLSQKELAEIVEVEPITVARLIDRLEERGLVERRDDPRDRRIWRLHLRPTAAPVLQSLHAERADMLRVVAGCLDPDLMQALKDGLTRMKSNVVADLRAQAHAGKSLEKDLA